MLNTKKILEGFCKQNISLAIFLFVNLIFMIKYCSRQTHYYLTFSVIITLIYWVIWNKKNHLNRLPITFSKQNFILIIFILVLSYFAFQKIPTASLHVDRWSVINSFWNNYFDNKYVYFAKSNAGNYPGPMPFYFVLALPFYFFGEFGWLSILGILLFYGFLKHSKTSQLNTTTGLLLVTCSVFFWWEILSRSNIFLNSTMVIFVLYHHINMQNYDKKNIIITGVLIGLVISTRNVLVIPFIITFVFQLKKRFIKPIQILFIGMVAGTTFIISFLPFVYNHIDDFQIMNPFIIQSTALVPFQYTMLFLFFAFISGLVCRSINDVFCYSGLVLFVSIFIYFLYHFSLVGFQKTFFDSFADISYFILCIPFCLFDILSTKKPLI